MNGYGFDDGLSNVRSKRDSNNTTPISEPEDKKVSNGSRSPGSSSQALRSDRGQETQEAATPTKSPSPRSCGKELELCHMARKSNGNSGLNRTRTLIFAYEWRCQLATQFPKRKQPGNQCQAWSHAKYFNAARQANDNTRKSAPTTTTIQRRFMKTEESTLA
ncbi:hypothetical protein Ocin01_17589 [Orchesella cincta]|uniref:Uncharacterized protein n=1 Tax=Orchesella cincta TaxID=48709 RepID=A0A1D2M7Y0_ORCCI|nr:hypothetical protein Ocin01_17589 [Orchesella cincta]